MKYTMLFILLGGLMFCSKKPGKLTIPSLQNMPINPNDIILTVVKDSILADGKSFAEALLKVGSTVTARNKEAIFELSPAGKFNTGTTTLKLTLDVNGEARTFITSEIDGIVYLKSTVGSLSRTVPIKFYSKTIDTLKIYVSRNDVPADNYSYAEITAVTKNLPPTNRQIIFFADKGLFSNNSNTYSIQTGSNDTTRAYLKYNKAELIRVTATVANNYSKELFVNYLVAWPTQVLIEPANPVLPPLFTSKTLITAKLNRIPGFVSEGQVVVFYDSTDSNPGRSIGSFFNTTVSNSAGNATAEYSLQDTAFRGFVYIKAYVQTGTNRVYGENRILIQK